MIVLSGVVGPSGRDLLQHCRKSLAGQRMFGVAAEPIDLGWACIGFAGEALASPIARFGPFTVVADARIDNLRDLKRRFGLSSGATPAEVLAALWARFGRQSPDHISGAFAYAVLDSDNRTVHLVRDHVGARPLVTAQKDGLWGFSSMASGVIGLTERKPNLPLFAQRLANLDRTEGHTVWDGITQVATASVTSIGVNTSETYRYFRPEEFESFPHSPDLLPQLSDLLDRSVAETLPDVDAVVAAHLSSGLDSTSVATSAGRVRRNSQQLIFYTSAPADDGPSLVAKNRIADESPIAAETARTIGARHVVVRDSGRIADNIRGKAHYFEDVVPSPINFGWILEIGRRAKMDGASAILTGLTGNATISFGGLIGLSDYLAQGRFLRWAKEAALAVRHNDISWKGTLFNSARPFLPPAVSEFLMFRFQRQSVSIQSPFLTFHADAGRQLDPRRAARPTATVRNDVLTRSDDPIRNKGLEALTGVEERDPLAARDLIEFCYRLPPEALIRGGQLKPLLIELLRQRLPGADLDPVRRGEQGTDWYARIDRADCLGLLEDVRSSHYARELLDLDALERAINAWPDYDRDRRGELISYFFQVTDALAAGYFLAAVERDPIGRV